MKRRSRVGSKPVKLRRNKAVTLKHREALKTMGRRRSASAGQQPEIARLRRELSEALEQQTVLRNELRQSPEQHRATSEVLSVISRSKFELQPILQSVLHTAMPLCRAEQAVIYRPEGGRYRLRPGTALFRTTWKLRNKRQFCQATDRSLAVPP